MENLENKSVRRAPVVPERRMTVYDFAIAESVLDIRTILQQINDSGYKIVGIAPYDCNIAIFFLRHAHG